MRSRVRGRIVPALLLVLALCGAIWARQWNPDVRRIQQRTMAVAPDDAASGAAVSGPPQFVPVAGRNTDVMAGEYPGHAGQYPWTGRTPEGAEAACHAIGARLCTDEEWTAACSDVAVQPQAGSGQIGIGRSLRCNDLFHGSGVSAPTGAYSGCRTRAGATDFTGNVWEYIQSDRSGEVWLKGGSYRDAGDTEGSCAYTLHLLRPQIDRLLLGNVGWRCCRDAP